VGVNGASTMSAIAFGGILYSLARIIIGIDSANVIFFMERIPLIFALFLFLF
jgi:hypothetical protein